MPLLKGLIMKTSLPALGAVALALLGFAPSPGQAQYFNPPQGPNPYYQPPCYVPRVAPDMCGGYFYCTDGSTWYGPSYNVYPPFPPFNGMLAACPKGPPPTPYQYAQKGPQAQAAVPYNPFTRGPRDYFMWTEAQQEVLTRQQRPAFVP
jgi:hypothetical protein